MKYRVTALMAGKTDSYKEGDIIECDPALAALRLSKGYLVPLDMVDAKEDKQLRSYKRKEK
jgi:hypothetical protein